MYVIELLFPFVKARTKNLNFLEVNRKYVIYANSDEQNCGYTSKPSFEGFQFIVNIADGTNAKGNNPCENYNGYSCGNGKNQG